MKQEEKPKLITNKGPEPFYGYPTTWWYRSRKNQDTKFVMSRMHFIPEHLKYEVSQQYTRLYKDGSGRGEANTYLNTEALKYKR